MSLVVAPSAVPGPIFDDLNDLPSRSFSSREELEAALEDNPFEIMGDFQINNQLRGIIMEQLWDMTPKQQAMIIPLNLRLEGNLADVMVFIQKQIDEIRNRDAATTYVANLFRTVRRAIWAPRRWSKLFKGLARRFEAEINRYRERLFTAVALDDLEDVRTLKTCIPEKLWLWWAYNLDLTARAARRNRGQLLHILPPLKGYLTAAARSDQIRKAMAARPPAGSRQASFEVPMFHTYISVVRKAMETRSEIDLAKLEENLGHINAGPWKTQAVCALGVNLSDPRGEYAGWRALHFVAHASAAVKTGSKAASMLLEAHADPDEGDVAGATALHSAAFRDNLPVLRVLLRMGASVEAQDQQGCGALITAARSRHRRIVIELALWAMPPDMHNRFLSSPDEQRWEPYGPLAGAKLLKQAADGNEALVRKLVEVGDSDGLAHILFMDSRGRSALHHTVMSMANDHSAIEMIRLLVALHAQVDACDLNGEAPLHLAARGGRHRLVHHLLRLHAHPGLKNRAGQTPLMVAALGPDEHPPPPRYDGVLVNQGCDLATFEDLLRWNGAGHAPGVRPRQAGSKTTGAKVRKLLDLPETAIPEGASPEYIPEQESALARAYAMLSLGFDDQHIFNAEGRVNRGDRLQLYRIIFSQDPNFMTVERRTRALWQSVTSPLLVMHGQGTLAPRLSELLLYIVTSIYGPRGMTMGLLATVGQEGRVLKPSWDAVHEVLKMGGLQNRVHAITQRFFRGPAARHSKWVGATWDRDEYPREPDSIPWDGLHYVEEETAHVLKSGPSAGPEAFHGNSLPIFADVGDERDAPRSSCQRTPHRAETFQLSHRLFIDEATGALGFVISRAKAIGERLICPLLQEIVDGFENEAVLQSSRKHRDMLQYLLQQSVPPQGGSFDYTAPYLEHWQAVRQSAVAALWRQPATLEAAITDNRWDSSNQGPVPTQASLLSADDRTWLLKQQTARAFIELWRCKGISDTEDFNKLIILLADETSVTCAEGGNFYIPPPLGTGVEVGSVVVIAAMRTHCELNGLFGRVTEHNPESQTFTVVLAESHRIVSLSPNNLQRVEEIGHGKKLAAAEKKKIFAKRFWHATYGLLIWGRALQLQSCFGLELRNILGPNADIRGPTLRPRADVLVGPAEPPSEHSEKHPLEALLEKMDGPDEFADLLKAEVICADTAAFAQAWAALVHSSQLYGALRIPGRRRTSVEEGQQRRRSSGLHAQIDSCRQSVDAVTTGSVGRRGSEMMQSRRSSGLQGSSRRGSAGSMWQGGLQEDMTLEIVQEESQELLDSSTSDLAPEAQRRSADDEILESDAEAEEEEEENKIKEGADAAQAANDDGTQACQEVKKKKKTKFATNIKILHIHMDKTSGKVFPRCAGILLTVSVTLKELGPAGGPPVAVLAQVELLFHSTLDARFLAEAMGLNPLVDQQPDKPMERWDPVRSRRRRPVHGTII